MKHILYSLIFCTLVGCGGKYTVNCEYDIDNICILEGGTEVFLQFNPLMFSWAIENANTNLNRFFDINIYDLLDEHELHVRYRDGLDYRGAYKPAYKLIELRPAHTDNEAINCIEGYYVFQHELMHFIADKSGMEEQGGNEHMVSNVFVQWAFANDMPFKETAEYYSYLDTWRECERVTGVEAFPGDGSTE